jgi:Mor family transcriptional regulator
MGYKNAIGVLPNDLLMTIQKYIDGEYIYIPRKAENKKQWGERKNSRGQLAKRNQAIFEQYQYGVSVEELAEQYYLSAKTVYKILSALKNNS